MTIRNVRLSFVKENKYKVGLNLVNNRLNSITNVVDKKWIDLSLESYKLECKKRIIQNSLLTCNHNESLINKIKIKSNYAKIC